MINKYGGIFNNSESILENFWSANKNKLNHLKPEDVERFRKKFTAWENEIQIKFHFLADHPEGYYDQAWTVTRDISPFSKSKHRSRFQVFVVAVKNDTHQILQFSFHSSMANLHHTRSPEYIARFIKEQANAPTHERQMVLLKEVRTEDPSQVTILKVLEDGVRTSIKRFDSFMDSELKTYLNRSKAKSLELSRIKDIVRSIFLNNIDVYKKVIEDHADLIALHYADEIYKDDIVSKKCATVHIYNHIIKTQASNQNARDYRYTALRQFLPLGDLFLGLPIWEKIDEGQTPLKVLADHFGVKQSTLKHMAQRPDIFKLGQETKKIAQYLDYVDLMIWPKSKEDLQGFRHVIKTSEVYASVFSKDAPETLGKWTKDKKQDVTKSWHHLAHALLKDEVVWLFENPGDNFRRLNILNRQNKPYIMNTRADLVRESFDRLPSVIKTLPAFWDAAISRFSGVISNIKDMKADVEKRIIQPMILLELEKQGFRVVEASILNQFTTTMQKSFWQSMTPSDQVSASSYWHSPAVNISRRFNSVALNEDYAEWPELVPKKTKLENNVLVHPLNSKAGLQEETDNMGGHCIWSYGSYFYRSNYHMLSLTGESGKRLSSLTVQDFFDNSGKRQVRFSQNKSFANAEPRAEAKKAAELLIHAINKQEIVPDWQAIDEARRDYKSRQIENMAGYDFRDADQRQKVFEVYLPCLPKKLLHGSDKTFENLCEKLRICDMVKEFVAAFDFSQGGISRIQDSSASLALSQAIQHRRPPEAFV